VKNSNGCIMLALLHTVTMKNQNGNVLFLILIAVALFAALSYAVTQTSRGDGNADQETREISVAELNQKISLVRSTIQRMMIIKRLSIDEIDMCMSTVCILPAIPTLGPCTTGENCVFAPEGGGLDPNLFVDIGYRPGFIESSAARTIQGHGTSNIILQLARFDPSTIDQGFCESLQESYGLSTTIEIEQTADTVLADGTPLEGQWDFCYDRGDGNLLSVHLLATD
jgi:hypothetical protein